MSDNVGYTPGSGATVAADNIGGVLHQRVKIGVGADGAAVDVSEANPMPTQAVGELIEAIEAMRMAVNALKKTIGNSLPNAQGFPIMEVRQGAAANLSVNATQTGTWNIGTITTLSNQTQIGGYGTNDQIPSLMAMRAASFRRNITVT